jgi:tetratricopeptide (TPR) repeat protein
MNFYFLVFFTLMLTNVQLSAQVSDLKELNSEDMLNLAVSEFDGKRYENCLNTLNRAIEINHNGELSDILYYYRALTYLKLEQENKAICDLDTAIAFNNQKIHYRELRLELNMHSIKFNDALTDIEQILVSNPNHELALLNKGIIMQQSGEIQNAINLYSKILTINSQNKESLYLRGMIYLQNAMADKGCVDIQLSANMNYKPALEALSRYCR